MINIKRKTEPPLSLQKEEIKNYLSDLAAYKLLPQPKRELSIIPKCKEYYRNEDIFEAFDRDFYSKCYLTEKKFANSYSMDVEHFQSKNFDQYPELKYEWTNLFPADHDANMTKPRKEPIGGYLNPCLDNVETDLIQLLLEDGKSNFSPKDEENIKAKNTAELLTRIHNGHDNYSETKTKELRHLISKKKDKVIETIINWLGAKVSGEIILEKEMELRLRSLLSRKNSFTMLLRSLSSVRKHVPKGFLD